MSLFEKSKMWCTNVFYTVLTWIYKFVRYFNNKFHQPKILLRPKVMKVIPIAPPKSLNLPKRNAIHDEGPRFLDILSWDLMIETNGKAHNTSLFFVMTQKGADSRLVVRRGQEFFIKLNLDRDYDPKADRVSLILTLEGIEKPHYGNGTFVIIPVLNVGEDADGHWRATLYSKDACSITIKIDPPADSVVGKWRFDVDVKRKELTGVTSYTTNQPIYMLFNPWCPEDTVYIADEEKRHEYVIQDVGYIYRGTHRNMLPTMWKYSQYKLNILDCALYLMTEVGKVQAYARNDPVTVSRVLSGTINSNGNDNKVIVSNWTNDFTQGTSPTYWMGSYTILKKFYERKKPVRYGQCWVFSGLYTTVCRALGLPCRVVTNYSSARDAEGSVIVDYIIDSEGKAVEGISGDSIWTFHTWNEVWMKRLDLGTEYDGWQAIDTSPSKTSDNSTQCGPASVVAIKKGEVRRAYNAELLFGEVNADLLFWKYNEAAEPMTLIRRDTTSVGKQIVTKPISIKEQEEDLTMNYKYPEESQEERKAMIEALNENNWKVSRFSVNKEFKDVNFHFKLRDDIMVGKSFKVGLVIENLNSEVEHRVSVILRVDSIMYTGKLHQPVKSILTERLVKPRTVEEIDLPVSWDEYGPRLQNQCVFNIACLAQIQDINYEYFTQEFFQLMKPKITTVITKRYPNQNRVDKESSFINPLPVPLHDGEFSIDAPFMDKDFKKKIEKPIMPGEKVSCSHWDKEYGNANMFKSSIKFRSKELDDVEAHYFSAIKYENGTH